MNNFGFYIKKLQLDGDHVEVANVEFIKGLNVIYGPSDTGKTFIYQCIDYMLGASKRPKTIPESKAYTSCKLEIKTYSGVNFTLERSLKGGGFNVYDENFNKIDELKAKNDTKKQKSISDFLLELCNFENKKIRKNIDGVSNRLYFQDLTKYFLVDEEIIITEQSPISQVPKRGFNALATFEKNVLKFILTGEDDSNIVVTLKKDEITNKKGKIELYGELIKQLEDELTTIDYKAIDSQIEKLDLTIASFQSDYILSNQEFKQYDEEKNLIYKKILDNESRQVSLNELLMRSNIMKKQYISDISRLKATVETGQALDMLTTSNCPICNNEVKDKTIDIQELLIATMAEIKKIYLLTSELEASQKIFEKEKKELEDTLFQEKKQYEEILLKIQNELKTTLQEISIKIQEFTDKKEELSKIKTIKEKVEKYTTQKETIQKVIEENSKINKDNNYEELTTTLFEPITQQIKTILAEMKFDNMDSVGFSDEILDFTIGEKNRKDFGKGYRAVLYAVFIISLFEYLKKKPYQVGFVLIDSPLNPYKPDEKKDNGVIPNNLAENFYRYLAKNIKDEQVILIENTPIPQDIEKSVNYIKYSKGNGFLPHKTT
jgi:hypothetical protein